MGFVAVFKYGFVVRRIIIVNPMIIQARRPLRNNPKIWFFAALFLASHI